MSITLTIAEEQTLCYKLFMFENFLLDDGPSDLVEENRYRPKECHGRKVLGRYLDSLCQSCPYRSQNLHPL